MAKPKRANRKSEKHTTPPSALIPQELKIEATQQTQNQKPAPEPEKNNSDPEVGKLANSWTRKEILKIIIQAFIALGSVGGVLVVYFMTSSQIEEYKKTVHAELRAYVVPMLPVPRIFFGTQAVAVPIVNLGKTPALHYSAALIFERCDSMTWKPNSLEWNPPNKRIRWLAPSVPDTETIKPYQWKNKGGIYLYGKIWYDDILGGHDSTLFAYQYEFFRGSFVRLAQYDYIN